MRGGAGQPPPGTAYKRMGTAQGRPGTGQQGGAAATANRGSNVQVDARPITNHGVSGMKTGVAGGGGRKVLDKNYFLSELRQKRSEIANVTQSMRVGRCMHAEIKDSIRHAASLSHQNPSPHHA